MGRRVVLWTVLVMILVAVLVATAALADRVPAPMAIHWGSEPDGAGSLRLATTVNVATMVLLGWGFVVAARFTRDRNGARWLIAGGTGLTVLMACIHLWMLWANLDAPSWEQAEPLGLALPGSLVVLVAATGLGWLLAPAEA